MTGTARTAIGLLDMVLGRFLMMRQRQRGGGTVLLYHRVTPEPDPAFPPLPPAVFEEHCTLIKRCFNVLPLGVMVARRRQGQSLKGCCAITFDDGYGDFLEHAYPILERHALPATHFLVVDCVLSGRAPWPLRLNRLVWNAQPDGQDARPCGGSWREEASALKTQLARMPAAERYSCLEEREAQFSLRPPEPRMLRAGDLAKCDPDLVEWGSHTVSHAMLGYCGSEMAQSELRESRGRLEEVVGSSIRCVSYPNNSYSPEVMRVAQACEYECAFAVNQCEIDGHAPLYALPRFDIGHMTARMLRLELSRALVPMRRLRDAFQTRSA
jgi:peptidoglycan/xylan/chitin deacetylase (PgdA/CDA1 family)